MINEKITPASVKYSKQSWKLERECQTKNKLRLIVFQKYNRKKADEAILCSLMGYLRENLELFTFFCRTGLPLARTRWVWSTFSSHCQLSSKQCRWLTSATWILFLLNFWGNAGIWTRGCWVRSKNTTSVLCSPLAPPPTLYSLIAFPNVSTEIIFLRASKQKDHWQKFYIFFHLNNFPIFNLFLLSGNFFMLLLAML